MLSYSQNKCSKKETGYGDYTEYDYFREIKDFD